MAIPEIETINQIIKVAQETKRKIQEACAHPPETLRKEYDGDTGNYDPSNDGYWCNFSCELCGKFWSADEGTEEYRRVGTIYGRYGQEPYIG